MRSFYVLDIIKYSLPEGGLYCRE